MIKYPPGGGRTCGAVVSICRMDTFLVTINDETEKIAMVFTISYLIY